MRRPFIAVVLALIAAAQIVLVAVGMVSGSNPHFDKGTSPHQSVVTQEALGAVTLGVLVLLLSQLPSLAKGRRLALAAMLWLGSLGLMAAWLLALGVERAS
jgi:hypothetical protein